jgi:hypothetical protein
MADEADAIRGHSFLLQKVVQRHPQGHNDISLKALRVV